MRSAWAPRTRGARSALLASATLVAALAGCTSADEIVPEAYRPSGARDAYRRALQQTGLASTALGMEWQRAADAALASPVQIPLPYEERGVLDERQAHAFGYSFPVARGQRVEVVLTMNAPTPVVFMDLFRVAAGGEPRVHVASADGPTRRLAFEPRQDAEYVLRLQPELLRGGAYRLHVRVVASLGFPVEGHGVGDIQSRFGVARDAGRRQHHGVDIFAPRGTPVLATSRALVRRVREQELGGLVVWLFDSERGLHLYYAHLDEQLVQADTWVNPGDIVGRVGNTGNARTTPPHLHFGIYGQGEGPLDPEPFLRQPRQGAAAISADAAFVGAFARSTGDAELRRRPDARADVAAVLPEGTPLRVWAVVGDGYRVALADGRGGFLRAREVRPEAYARAGN